MKYRIGDKIAVFDNGQYKGDEAFLFPKIGYYYPGIFKGSFDKDGVTYGIIQHIQGPWKMWPLAFIHFEKDVAHKYPNYRGVVIHVPSSHCEHLGTRKIGDE